MPKTEVNPPAAETPVDRLTLGAVDPRGATPSVCYKYNCFADE